MKRNNVLFKTNSDTEVIFVKIYEIYGLQGFSKFNGMWAFIIYDSNKNLIIASRDRYSIKPLFWNRVGDKFFFASEIKQLLRFLPQLEINKKTVSLYLLQGLMDNSSETFFSGIEQLQIKVKSDR